MVGPTSFKAEHCYPLPLQNTPLASQCKLVNLGMQVAWGRPCNRPHLVCSTNRWWWELSLSYSTFKEADSKSPRKFFLWMQSYGHSYTCLTSPWTQQLWKPVPCSYVAMIPYLLPVAFLGEILGTQWRSHLPARPRKPWTTLRGKESFALNIYFTPYTSTSKEHRGRGGKKEFKSRRGLEGVLPCLLGRTWLT